MGRPLEKSALPFAEKLFTIIWMNETMSRCFGSPSVDVDTQILERPVIGIEWASIRPKDTDVLRREVQNLPKLHLPLSNFLLNLLGCRDVGILKSIIGTPWT
jgi:hypothetical protein